MELTKIFQICLFMRATKIFLIKLVAKPLLTIQAMKAMNLIASVIYVINHLSMVDLHARMLLLHLYNQLYLMAQ